MAQLAGNHLVLWRHTSACFGDPGVHEFFGVTDSYLYEILNIWVFEPLYGWLAVLAGAMAVLVCTNSCA